MSLEHVSCSLFDSVIFEEEKKSWRNLHCLMSTAFANVWLITSLLIGMNWWPSSQGLNSFINLFFLSINTYSSIIIIKFILNY